MNIDPKLLLRVEQEMDSYHARFERFFLRSEPREQSRKYLQGLLSASDRRNGWELAETMGDSVPDRIQRLLYRAEWDVEGVRDEHIQFCAEHFGSPHGAFIVDETGFLKSGNSSAGVQRQYTGTAGKITNCQIGTFLGYTSRHGSVLLDRRLYMPKCWCGDAQRRSRAHVPANLAFATKPEHALEMLRHAVQVLAFPGRWVVGDEVYGNCPEFRKGVGNLGLSYIVAVSGTTQVVRVVGNPRGRPALSFWPDNVAMEVEKIARNIPPTRWKSIATSPGEKRPIRYLWTAVRIMFPQRDEGWLLIRRNLGDCDEMAFYLSNASGQTSVATLAKIALQRFAIEQCFSEAKTEAGLDEYEVRLWPAWYRHITLAIMAHAFLVATKKTLPKAVLLECFSRPRCRQADPPAPRRHRKRVFLHGLGRVQSPKENSGADKPLQKPLLQNVSA